MRALSAPAIEPVASIAKLMPSGITVTPAGRTFLCFPRWLDAYDITVGELGDSPGDVVGFPDRLTNRIDPRRAIERFFSVQSVVAVDDTTLWVLDSGRPFYLPALPGAAKLVEVDIATRELRRTYVFPSGVAGVGTYLNDVRLHTHADGSGTAYITDSATFAPSAIIVVDLASGRSMRRLAGYAPVQADPEVVLQVDGGPVLWRLGPICFPYRAGADGIALSRDGSVLYFTPLNSRRLYSVSAALLADSSASDADIARTVVDCGPKCTCDGLEIDEYDGLYAGNLEAGSIERRDPATGAWHTLAQGRDLPWIDSLCAAADGYLYFTVNQISRMRNFNNGMDRRQGPYLICRIRRP